MLQWVIPSVIYLKVTVTLRSLDVTAVLLKTDFIQIRRQNSHESKHLRRKEGFGFCHHGQSLAVLSSRQA